MKKMYEYGDRIRYKCNNGYDKYYDGDYYEYATCKQDGMWDKKHPTCRKRQSGKDFAPFLHLTLLFSNVRLLTTTTDYHENSAYVR